MPLSADWLPVSTPLVLRKVHQAASTPWVRFCRLSAWQRFSYPDSPIECGNSWRVRGDEFYLERQYQIRYYTHREQADQTARCHAQQSTQLAD